MKSRSTIFLLVIVLFLGVFIWIQEEWRVGSRSRRQQQDRLLNLDAGTLVSIEFKLTNTVVKCVKENDLWMVGDGQESVGRADTAMVLRMIAGLNSMQKGATITMENLEMRGIGLDEYGFDEPSVEIQVIDNWGRHEWQIGRKTPLGDMVYAREAEGGEVYTIPDVLLELVPPSADELRDRTIFFGDLSGVRRVEIRGSEGFIQIVQDPKSGWQLQQPLVAQADGNKIDAYLKRLFQLRVESFIADNVSDFSIYGLQGEMRQISLTGADGSSRMLMLGDEIADKPDYVFARRADDTSVFALKAEVFDLLDVKGDGFRDAGVLDLPVKKISYVSVERSGETLTLSKDNQGVWNILKPVSWMADTYAVETLLKTWNEAVITEFDRASADDPEYILWFGSRELSTTNQIAVFPTRGRKDGLLIKRNSDPALYQINIPVISEKVLDPLAYKNKVVWHISPDGINRISIEKASGSREAVEKTAEGRFVQAGSNMSMEVDPHAIDLLLSFLEVLSTPEYVARNPSDLSIYGLDDPSVVLQIDLADTSQLGKTLLVGRETVDGYFAMVKGRDVVFMLDKLFVQVASGHLLHEPDAVGSANE